MSVKGSSQSTILGKRCQVNCEDAGSRQHLDGLGSCHWCHPVGKPAPYLYGLALKRLGGAKAITAAVRDRIDTDIMVTAHIDAGDASVFLVALQVF
jgi:hypothetical protein